MASLTATADSTTGTIRVDVEQTLARDTFSRVVANGWGNATSGQAYTVTGGAVGDYSVDGASGLHAINTVNVARHSTIAVSAGADTESRIQVAISVLAAGAPLITSLMGRFVDTSNYYFAEISISAATQVATLNLRKNVLGVATTLASVTLDPIHALGAVWHMALSCCGSTIKAKAWRTPNGEPDWMLTAVDADLVTGTRAGARSMLATGNTNGLVTFFYDSFTVIVGQPIRLWRVPIGGARTEVRGSPGSTEAPSATANTATATFYDNESPFDVTLSYELTSACSDVVEVTSNAVFLDSEDDGWLRDPVDPTLNIRIDFQAGIFDYCVEGNAVVFGGFGTRVFANASGIFDIVDAARVSTVSMTRKRYASNLILISKTLIDGDAVEAIIAKGRVLLLSLPAIYGFGRPTNMDYISIFDVSSDTIGVDQTLAARVWDLPFRLANAPVDTDEGGTGGNGIGVPGATYNDLAGSALGVTYANLAASGETYLQVAQGVGY